MTEDARNPGQPSPIFKEGEEAEKCGDRAASGPPWPRTPQKPFRVMQSGTVVRSQQDARPRPRKQDLQNHGGGFASRQWLLSTLFPRLPPPCRASTGTRRAVGTKWQGHH